MKRSRAVSREPGSGRRSAKDSANSRAASATGGGSSKTTVSSAARRSSGNEALGVAWSTTPPYFNRPAASRNCTYALRDWSSAHAWRCSSRVAWTVAMRAFARVDTPRAVQRSGRRWQRGLAQGRLGLARAADERLGRVRSADASTSRRPPARARCGPAAPGARCRPGPAVRWSRPGACSCRRAAGESLRGAPVRRLIRLPPFVCELRPTARADGTASLTVGCLLRRLLLGRPPHLCLTFPGGP